MDQLINYKIVNFDNTKNIFEIWKKFTIEEINNENDIKMKSIKNFNNYIFMWKDLNEILNNENKEEKSKILESNYIEEYENYINNKTENSINENELCIISYDNFLERNVNIYYKEENDYDFIKFFYSAINIIKENKFLIPKNFYLYELIYPQTNNGFPILNKFNYYFVKLFINNKWMLVFINLLLPCDDKNNIISCHSLNPNEIWIYIIIKSLYRCFEIFNFSNYYLYIIELLTGLKCIENNFNYNMILQNNKNKNIQCFLLSEEKKNNKKDENINSKLQIDNIINEHINKKLLNDHFFFLICAIEEEYFGIKCENIISQNSIKFDNSIFHKIKYNIPKGYKYLSEKGNIKIENKELTPFLNLSSEENNLIYSLDIDKNKCQNDKKKKKKYR